MTALPDRPSPESSLSRRKILGRLSAAAVGGGALAVYGAPLAAADSGDNFVIGDISNSATDATGLGVWGNPVGLWVQTAYNEPMAPGFAIRGQAHDGSTGVLGTVPDHGYGVSGRAGRGFGVLGVAEHSAGIGTAGEGADGGTGVRGKVPNAGHGVLGQAGIGFGVKGEASKTSGIGVAGTCVNGGTAVRGSVPNHGYGVRGKAGAGFGLLGEVTTGVGVSGESSDNGWGVRGKALNGGWGVQGTSDTSFGVRGDSTGGTGVRGESQTDVGVYGRSLYHTGVTGYGAIAGVRGQCDPGGTAVTGTSSAGGYGVRGETDTGIGVSGSADKGVAISGEGRWGGQFKGTRAAVRLVPTASDGAPTSGSHLRGELICDNNGQFWGCSADGTPGTWVRLG